MEVIPERGDIWWIALDPTLGSEIRKTRPCVVISVKVLNERRRTVIVVPLSKMCIRDRSLGDPTNERDGQETGADRDWLVSRDF